MLLFIKGRFQILQEQLASSIFSMIWKNLAQALNKCIYEEVGDVLTKILNIQNEISRGNRMNLLVQYVIYGHE